ncbi:MAG: DUF4276 family protein [Phycisphaerae bacterium]|nr:DUF4276 family protein [Planctomycetota bacterium]MBL7220386.1 DUF4276 family protein [Phycisphaerae bacterium]
MKFILFCEGETERKALPAFLKRWLDPRLNAPVGVKPVRFDGWTELIDDAPVKAELYLEGPRSDDVVGVIGLLDLCDPTYPGGVETIAERNDWMKNHVESKVSLPKFRMFCAVHEIEAWLLSDPKLLPQEVASALPGKAGNPETVNFSEPPAKLLNKLYREKTGSGYKKVVYGSDMFSRLDPDTAYAKCPYLAALLDEMLQMAHDAGL